VDASAATAGAGLLQTARPTVSKKHFTKRLTIARAGRIFNRMVDKDSGRLDAVFQALADPTRRAMLRDLATHPRTVGELAAPYDISLAGASKHIQVLERAGLIQREIQGRVHTCRIDARPLHAGAEWIRHYERFWNQKLDALEALLKAQDAARPAAKSARKPSKPRTPRRKS
jgi:DNA-binding transcriptional ArsR family regulator